MLLLSKGSQGMAHVTSFISSRIPTVIDFSIRVVLSLIVFAIGVKVIKFVRKIVRRSLQKSNVDKGAEQFIDSLTKVGLYILLIAAIGKNFGIDSASVAALLASGGVAIGLALQGSLSNFAGGILILLLKPFVVGDYIIEDNKKNEGTVKEIQIFYTKLSTPDNKTIVIPNGALANSSLTNVTDKNVRRLDLTVDISYEADLKKAKELIKEIFMKDEATLKDQDINIFVDQLGASSVVIGARAWVSADDYWTAKWRLLEEIKLTMDANGIEIPYQHVTVQMKETAEN